MATSKNKKENIITLLFSNSLQEKNVQIIQILQIYVFGLILTAIFSTLKASLYNQKIWETFFSVFIALPLLLLILFTLIHIFLEAFSNSKIKFWKSYFLFSIVLMVEIVIGNFFNLLQAYFENEKLNYLLGIIIILLIVFIGILLSRKLKTYYKASYAQIIATYVLTTLTLAIILFGTYVFINS